MFNPTEIDNLTQLKELKYRDVLNSIDNIPPCFSETRTNIKKQFDLYIESSDNLTHYFGNIGYNIGFIDGYNYFQKNFNTKDI